MKKEHKEICESLARTHMLMVKNGFSADPRKWRETSASLQGGQEPSTKKSGADCYETVDGTKEECERKSRVGQLQGNYTGISVQKTWAEQHDYILNKKVGNYKYHFFDHICPTTGTLVESWKLDAEILLKLMLPSLKDQYTQRMKQFREGTPPKDPRLSFTLGATAIRKYGIQIIKNGKRIK